MKTRTLLIFISMACAILVLFSSALGLYGKVLIFGGIFAALLLVCARHLDKIRFFIIDLFFHPIIINALISVKFGCIKHYNLGDDLNWFLLKKIQKQKISLLNSSVIGKILKKENYLVIGSTIALLTTPQTIVWGAGVIEGNLPLKAIPKRICAVRGPLTRKFFLERGVDCPPIYGDPALLMKYFYNPQTRKKYKLGIIPHYVDFYSKKFSLLRHDQDVLFIKMQKYESVQSVIDQIGSCEKIISSSLHGLILSETYNVPNIWMNVSDNVVGGFFKYKDFFESIGICDARPYFFKGNETKDELLGLFDGYKKGHIDLKPLIAAAPFKLNLKLSDVI